MPYRITVGIALLVCAYTAFADGDTPYLATITIERAAGATTELGDDAVATLHVDDPAKTAQSLATLSGLKVLETNETTVRVRYGPRPVFSGPIEAIQTQSTWVVDYDEASIQALLPQLASEKGERLSPAELQRFVFEHIDNKTYSRSFDLASRVAATGEGDCTEHAVLLAALARAGGYPARIVFGILIIDADEQLRAFGHAWTEIHDGREWRLHDATLPGNVASQPHMMYLPAGTLAEEGPGYFLSLAETMTSMPARISDVDSAD